MLSCPIQALLSRDGTTGSSLGPPTAVIYRENDMFIGHSDGGNSLLGCRLFPDDTYLHSTDKQGSKNEVDSNFKGDFFNMKKIRTLF